MALLIHKIVIGFSLGIRLAQSALRPILMIACFVVFAGQVLIGGFIGLALMDAMHSGSQGATSMVSGLLQASGFVL